MLLTKVVVLMVKNQTILSSFQNNEKKRIEDIIQDREDKRLYKIALKEAKQKWKVGVRIFR